MSNIICDLSGISSNKLITNKDVYSIFSMDKLEIMDGPENFSELTEITNMIDFYRFRSTIHPHSIADDSDSNT